MVYYLGPAEWNSNRQFWPQHAKVSLIPKNFAPQGHQTFAKWGEWLFGFDFSWKIVSINLGIIDVKFLFTPALWRVQTHWVHSSQKCNLINVILVHEKVPSPYSRDRAKSANFQKEQFTLAPNLLLTDGTSGNWPGSPSNLYSLPAWGLMEVGRVPGKASLTPESAVLGHSSAFRGPQKDTQARPTWNNQEVQAGCESNQEAGPSASAWSGKGHGPRTWCLVLPQWPISQTLGLLTQTTQFWCEDRGLPVV